MNKEAMESNVKGYIDPTSFTIPDSARGFDKRLDAVIRLQDKMKRNRTIVNVVVGYRANGA